MVRVVKNRDGIETFVPPTRGGTWGSQVRSYVMQPYRLVKDLRTGVTLTDADAASVLDGNLDPFLREQLVQRVWRTYLPRNPRAPRAE